jgi:hypothetical protein
LLEISHHTTLVSFVVFLAIFLPMPLYRNF